MSTKKLSPQMVAKYHLKSLYDKKEFYEILESVLLTPLEFRIIEKMFMYNKSALIISSEEDLSESSIKRWQKIALNKIYLYLYRTQMRHNTN